jgi:hypothetical protein
LFDTFKDEEAALKKQLFFMIDMPKYNHIENIPAKIFFDIVKTKDYQKLKPKPKEKDLDKVFLSIYDDYFIRSENDKAKQFLELQNKLLANEFKISILKQSLAFYFYNQTTKEMRDQFIVAVKTGFGIEINPELPFIDEVKRLLNIEIGILENESSRAKIRIEEMNTSSQTNDFDFYDAMINLSNILVGNSLIKDDITLAVYVALEKSSRKVIANSNKQK